MDAPPPTIAPTPTNAPPAAFRVLPAVLWIALAAVVAAHLPPRWKLLTLTPVALGIAAGWIAGTYLPRTMGLPRTTGRGQRLRLPLAALLVAFGIVGYAGESFRVWRAARADEVAANLTRQPGGAALLDRVRRGESGTGPEADLLTSYRTALRPPLAAYLRERLAGVTTRPRDPWPALVWAGELVAAWIAGVVTAAGMGRRPDDPGATA